MNEGYSWYGAWFRRFCTASFIFAAYTGSSATLYVDLNSPTPTPPFTNWDTAAHSIQAAIDAAGFHDLVLVTNGVYAEGGKPFSNGMTNRVILTKPIAVQSVNGPEFTIIEGYQVPGITNGPGAIRCVYMRGGSLSGFTLTKGATASIVEYGGGVWASDGSLTNCVLVGNSADFRGGGIYSSPHSVFATGCTMAGNSAYLGGGAYGATLDTCNLVGNRSNEGGGAYDCMLVHCTVFGNFADHGGGTANGSLDNCNVIGNSARFAGGVHGGSLYNCIVSFNHAGADPNFDSASMSYCCTTPLPPSGTGNIDADPALASLSHLSASSPCRGTAQFTPLMGVTTDVDGEAWGKPPAIGCDEYVSGAVTGALSAAITAPYTNVSAGFRTDFAGLIEGRTSGNFWDFGDGTRITNCPVPQHAWAQPGDYPVALTAWNESHPEGVSTQIVVHVVNRPVHYVSLESTTPVPPYSSWETAATEIQAGVDAVQSAGALVLVGDGIYNVGGRAVHGTLTNRVVLDKPITLQSVNGPNETIIEGAQVPGTTNGDGAIRCVYLGDGSTLSGFTLTNGATRSNGLLELEQKGGGVWCASALGVVTNCVVTGNSSYERGGGARGGTLRRCVVSGNSSYYGGGAYESVLENCVIHHNRARSGGGGADNCWLENCTVTANTGSSGVYYGSMNNCIVYFNDNADYSMVDLSFCCASALFRPGSGNFTNAPLFVDMEAGDYHLQPGSPCINAGQTIPDLSPVDFDGNPRVVGGSVDVGAYEFPTPASAVSFAWLQSFGLPCDGSADCADSDSDGMNSYQEWVAGTDPLDPASVLRLVAITHVPPITLTWESLTNRTYFVERASDLSEHAAFKRVASKIAGRSPTTAFSDSNAPPTGPVLYRVGAEKP